MTYRPFSLVRDLRGSHLDILVPHDLVERIVRIDLVANSTKHFDRCLRLLSIPRSELTWINVNPRIKGEYGAEHEVPYILWAYRRAA